MSTPSNHWTGQNQDHPRPTNHHTLTNRLKSNHHQLGGYSKTNNTDEATVSDHLGQTPKKFHGRTNIGPTVDCVFSITYKLKDHKCTEKIIKAFMGTLNWVTSSSLSLQPTVLAFLDSEGGNCVLKKTYLISTNWIVDFWPVFTRFVSKMDRPPWTNIMSVLWQVRPWNCQTSQRHPKTIFGFNFSMVLVLGGLYTPLF